MSSVYDSAKDIFYVRTWRCAGEAISASFNTNVATANSLFHQKADIQRSGTTANLALWMSKNENISDGTFANVSYLTAVTDLVGTRWENAWKFAVVRNPYSVVYSEWKAVNKTFNLIKNLESLEIAKERGNGTSGVPSDQMEAVCNDFNEYVKYKFETATQYTGIMGINKYGMAGSLYHENGDLGVDEVLYYEDLANEWTTKVKTPKGYSHNINIVDNNTPDSEIYGSFANTAWTDAYNDKSKDLVSNFYCADLEIFGYTFEDGNNKPTDHTIPTSVNVDPRGPFAGKSQPTRWHAANGGLGQNIDCVDRYFLEKTKIAVMKYNLEN